MTLVVLNQQVFLVFFLWSPQPRLGFFQRVVMGGDMCKRIEDICKSDVVMHC